MFLHSSNLGPFGPGSVVRCTVYLHNGRAQAKNLEEASPAELAVADGSGMDGGKGMGGQSGGGLVPTGGAGPGMPGHIPDQELGQYVGTEPLPCFPLLS